jgi:hypothetical protein
VTSPPNSDENRLLQLAQDGSVPARIDLAFHYESAGNTELAAHWMDQAAASGDAGAKMQRAAWKLYGSNFERDEEAAFLEIQDVAGAGGEGNSRSFLAVLLAYGIGWFEPLGRFEAPLTALFAVALVPRWAPVSLLLAVPEYGSLAQCFWVALTWLGLDVLFDVALERLRDEAIAPCVRGWPVRLLILGVLYYTLQPLAWL